MSRPIETAPGAHSARKDETAFPAFPAFTLCGGEAGERKAVLDRLVAAGRPRRVDEGDGDGNGLPSLYLEVEGRLLRAFMPNDGVDHDRQLAADLARSDLIAIRTNAEAGLDSRARRLMLIAHLFAVPHVIVLVDGMADASWSESAFLAVSEAAATLADTVRMPAMACIPIATAADDNLTRPSTRMGWYEGPTVLTAICGIDTDASAASGEMATATRISCERADQVAADLLWTSATALLPGRPYRARCAGQRVRATITRLKHRLDVDNLASLAAKRLHRGEIGYVNLSFADPIAFDAGEENRATGRFVLEDALTGETVGMGMIRFALRRASNISWQALDVDRSARAAIKGQRPCCLWFTGLSGSGKSTLASLLEKRLHALGRHTYVLDGDNVRHGLNRDLGFTDAERVENIRRVAEVARLMVDAGLIVLVAFISPFRAERGMARTLFDDGEFLEVFVDAKLAVCETRDPKGLYAKARAGLIANFTGIDSTYEPPVRADLHLDTAGPSPEVHVSRILKALKDRSFI